MTALALDVRELNTDEIDEVNGAWVANAVGGAVGAVGGGIAGYAMSGGDWKSAAGGALAGGLTGALSPVSGFRGAAYSLRYLQASVVGGAAGAGINVYSN